jgi:glycerophosphoryl diester phosphodiesterase
MNHPLFVFHAAHRGDRHPPSSLGGIRDCLAAGARAIEVDIVPLADGDFVLAHDAALESFSEGKGPVMSTTAAQVRGLHYRWRGATSAEPLGLLSQALALIREYRGPVELQLDLKEHAPLTDPILAALVAQIMPVKPCVRVSSAADWAIRRLRSLDPALPLGFDPMFYLDVERGDGDKEPPLRMGAYGYVDEHPLALRRWGTPPAYLAARAEALWTQAPVDTWYIRGAMLARALDDGFDWIAWLHARGAQVVAWTLDAAHPHQLDLARMLAAAGVDRITTNDAEALSAML